MSCDSQKCRAYVRFHISITDVISPPSPIVCGLICFNVLSSNIWRMLSMLQAALPQNGEDGKFQSLIISSPSGTGGSLRGTLQETVYSSVSTKLSYTDEGRQGYLWNQGVNSVLFGTVLTSPLVDAGPNMI